LLLYITTKKVQKDKIFHAKEYNEEILLNTRQKIAHQSTISYE